MISAFQYMNCNKALTLITIGMKKLAVILLLFISFQGWSQSERPKLVVGIVVDQMRQDYLYRYWNQFSDDGFKRLTGQGFMLKNAHYNYIPTNTGPGHAAIYSGTTPAFNGIIKIIQEIRKYLIKNIE